MWLKVLVLGSCLLLSFCSLDVQCYIVRNQNGAQVGRPSLPSSSPDFASNDCAAVAMSSSSMKVSWCGGNEKLSEPRYEVAVTCESPCIECPGRSETVELSNCERVLKGLCAEQKYTIDVKINGALKYQCNGTTNHEGGAPTVASEFDKFRTPDVFLDNRQEDSRSLTTNSSLQNGTSVLQGLHRAVESNLPSSNQQKEKSSSGNTSQKLNSSVGAPGPPESLSVTALDSTRVKVSWTRPEEPNGPIYEYELKWTWGARTGSWSPSGDETTYLVQGLTPNSKVSFTLRACILDEERQQIRCGTIISTDTMTHPAAPSAPTSLVLNASSTQVTLEWKPPGKPNGPIDGYYYCQGSDCEREQRVPRDKTSVTVGNLKPYTQYVFRVWAFNLDSDKRELAGGKIEQSIKTHAAAPGPPKLRGNVEVVMRSIKLEWDEPEVKNGPLDGYTVRITPSGGGSRNTLTRETTNTWWTEENLTPWTVYEICVHAYNIDTVDHQIRLISPGVSATTRVLEDVPGPPASMKAIAVDSRQIIVSWTMPERPNIPVDFYMLQWKWDGNRLMSYSPEGHETSYIVSRLVPYKEYTFSLKACVEVEDKPLCGQSVLGNARTHPAAPGPPATLHARIVDSTTVNVSWTIPKFRNGPIDYYQLSWFWGMGRSASNSFDGFETSFLLKRLIPYTKYKFSLIACNYCDDCEDTMCGKNVSVDTRTHASVPGPPASLLATAVDSRSMNVSWTRPKLSNGPIDHYELKWTWGPGRTSSHTFDGHETSTLLEKLTPYTKYFFALVACNYPEDDQELLCGKSVSADARTYASGVPPVHPKLH